MFYCIRRVDLYQEACRQANVVRYAVIKYTAHFESATIVLSKIVGRSPLCFITVVKQQIQQLLRFGIIYIQEKMKTKGDNPRR